MQAATAVEDAIHKHAQALEEADHADEAQRPHDAQDAEDAHGADLDIAEESCCRNCCC